MIFWISVGIALVVAAIFWWTDEAGWFGSLFCGAIAGALVWLFIGLALVGGITGGMKPQEEYRTALKALAASKSVTGQFFLGSGSVNGKRTINYITADGNRNYLQEADAARSTVIEDTPLEAGPHLIKFNRCMTNPWIQPWTVCSPLDQQDRDTEFHIPAGSVLSDYTVDNK